MFNRVNATAEIQARNCLRKQAQLPLLCFEKEFAAIRATHERLAAEGDFREFLQSDLRTLVEERLLTRVSKARTMAVSTMSHKRVGRPPKDGRRRRRGRPRKTEAA